MTKEELEAKNADIIIAVDPDIQKNGLAVLRKDTKRISVFALPFAECFWRIWNLCDAAREKNEKAIVLVEGGWLNQSNWHFSYADNRTKCAAIGRKVGMNHQCGIDMLAMLKHFGVDAYEVKPLEKHWQGRERKITQEEITQFIPDLPKRMNQEERDAALIAWVYGGFQTKLKTI